MKDFNRKVEDASIYGRLPELSISLTDRLYVTSFMTAEGQPAWTIFSGSAKEHRSGSIAVRNGRIHEDLEVEMTRGGVGRPEPEMTIWVTFMAVGSFTARVPEMVA